MKKIFRSFVLLFLIITFSNTNVFAKSIISSYGKLNLATPQPTVTTPIYLCQNSVATPLTAIPSVVGATLKWYTALTGGVPLPGVPTPITTTVGSTTYYVTETPLLGVESTPRTPIVVNVVADNGAFIVGYTCDPSQILPADKSSSVFFDWGNSLLIPDNSYNYTYTTTGGLSGSGTTTVSHQQVFGMSPGQTATIILTATTHPCATQTWKCPVPCGATTTTPTFTQIAPFCSGTTPIPTLPPSSNESITGIWSPAIINNTSNGVYTFTPDPILFPCALKQTMSITVDPLVTPAFSGIPAVVCQSAIAPILPLKSSNVTPITGTWSPALVDTTILGPVTYTFTPTIGQCASATLTTTTITILPNVTPSFLPIPPFCSGTTAPLLLTTSPVGITGTWSPATISNTISGNYLFTPNANQCSSTQTLSVTIISRTIPDFAAISPFCSGSVVPILTPTSPNGVTGTWTPATISNTTNGSYLFTPNATECATTQTLIVTVNPNVTPLFNPVPAVCSGAIMTPLPITSTNGITGIWTPSLNNLATTTYTFTPTAGLCATFTTLTISVNPIVAPNFAPIPNVCSGSTASILATTSPSGIVGTWSPAIISNTTNGSYTFTPAAGQCSTTQTLNVTITPRVVTNFAVIPAFCSGTVSPILAPMSPNGVSGTWSPATISNTTSGSYLFTPNPTECATTQTLNVVVNPLITPDFVDISMCSGTVAPILATTSPNEITGTWAPSTINNTTSGAYVFTPDAPQCATTKTINVTVNPSNTLVKVDYTVTDAFSKNQIVTITATAAGNYLYQMDNGPFQTSPVFENVASGIHSITVIDANGCSTPITDNNVLVIGYPKYFTPNGDNYNDNWNISALSDQLNARIYIFDRFGKLLKDISPKDSGWDGTYIGQPMPADDYWFTVEYVEQSIVKKYKSHFSLKR